MIIGFIYQNVVVFCTVLTLKLKLGLRARVIATGSAKWVIVQNWKSLVLAN